MSRQKVKCEHDEYKVIKEGSQIEGPHQENFWETRKCKKCGLVYDEEYL